MSPIFSIIDGNVNVAGVNSRLVRCGQMGIIVSFVPQLVINAVKPCVVHNWNGPVLPDPEKDFVILTF